MKQSATNAQATSVVVAKNLDKHYGAFKALDDVSFELVPGSVTGLLGPNGAGKSTLLKTLLGFLPHSAGSMEVLGYSPTKAPLTARQRVGYMPENETWFPERTGLESVVFAGRLSGMPKEQAFSRAYEVLDYLGMDEVRHRRVSEYSVGLKQNIKLGQAVVHGPRLLFLDEPMSGLDPRSRDEMMELLAGITRSGVAMVLSSHVLNDVETLCNDVLMMDRGKILYSGPLQTLQRAQEGHYKLEVRQESDSFLEELEQHFPGVEKARLGYSVRLRDAEARKSLWQLARKHGVQIRGLTPSRDSLEEAFLRLLGKGE